MQARWRPLVLRVAAHDTAGFYPVPILCGVNYDVQVQRIDYDDC